MGTGATGAAFQGEAVAVSADGNTAVVGGYGDNNDIGAVWIYTRSGGAWTQQGDKLVGTGNTGTDGATQNGISFALSIPAMLDSLSGQLDRYMTLLSQSQKLVASNIANADTPGYKTKSLDFESEFQHAQDTHSNIMPVISETSGLRVKEDGNNVDLDREARRLSENALRFSIASNLVRNNLKALRSAIQGGATSE